MRCRVKKADKICDWVDIRKPNPERIHLPL